MAIEGGGADDGRVPGAPVALEDPLGGGRKLVHHLGVSMVIGKCCYRKQELMSAEGAKIRAGKLLKQ